MNYLILHYFFMFCICSRRIAGSGISKRTNNYDIDDFISQLLTSQKFDELAEKVADKAVVKIKNMDYFPVLENKNMNENQHRYQEKKRGFDLHGLACMEREQRNNQNEKNLRVAKIDTQAFLKQENEFSQSDDLTLKYKYLKKHAQERKDLNDKHFISEEHTPIWRNIEITEEKNKAKEMSDEERHVAIQAQHFSQGSPEKNINFDKNIDFNKNINFDKNININFDKAINFDRNINFDKTMSFDKSLNFDKNIKFNKNINYDKTINLDKNSFDRNFNINRYYNGRDIIDKNNFAKAMTFEDLNTNYEKHDEHTKFLNGNENQEYKHTFLNGHGEEPAKYRNDRGGRKKFTERFKHDFEHRPQFNTENALQNPLRLQQKDSLEESPTIIDLDDNNDSSATKPHGTDEYKNIYRAIVEQQKNIKKEYRDDDKMRDDDNGWRADRKMFGDDNSDESGFKKQHNDDDSPVATGLKRSFTTRKQNRIRREGNQFYKYLSGPEYAEYHEALAKQGKTKKE